MADASTATLVVYRAIVAQPSARLAAIARQCGLSAEDVSRAVATLVRAGVLRPRSDDSGFEITVSSDAALYGMLARSGEAPADLLRGRHDLQQLTRSSSQGMPGVRTVIDPGKVEEVLERALAAGGQTVISAVAGASLAANALAEAREQDEALLHSGLEVLAVYPASFVRDQATLGYIRDVAALGAQIRLADAVPHRLIVFDERTAIVPLDIRRVEAGVLLVEQSSLVRSLAYFAIGLWRAGRSLAEVSESAEETLSPTEHRVLLMMSSGVTDEVAARRLGISERTFRRYVSKLMERLGTASRFQAGMQAVRRGWL